MLEKFDDNLEARTYRWLQGWFDVKESDRNSIQVTIPEKSIPDVFIRRVTVK
jgi:hypothetical protein